MAEKLTGNIGFEVKNAVAEQFLGYLDGSTQLVSADGNLRESIAAVLIRTLLVNPIGSTLGCNHRNLTLTAVGLYGVSQLT